MGGTNEWVGPGVGKEIPQREPKGSLQEWYSRFSRPRGIGTGIGTPLTQVKTEVRDTGGDEHLSVSESTGEG